jgi:hypothetical protein
VNALEALGHNRHDTGEACPSLPNHANPCPVLARED